MTYAQKRLIDLIKNYLLNRYNFVANCGFFSKQIINSKNW